MDVYKDIFHGPLGKNLFHVEFGQNLCGISHNLITSELLNTLAENIKPAIKTKTRKNECLEFISGHVCHQWNLHSTRIVGTFQLCDFAAALYLQILRFRHAPQQRAHAMANPLQRKRSARSGTWWCNQKIIEWSWVSARRTNGLRSSM